ncbi:hypothetical protein ymoll0001_36270 [Yersinia mollaretii ATCC 43969]|uniref:Uncharacterized protein n=1 Tax=Yersinia mollaretii (strain ATCC 43969 / DSM 18520 / CIP 103324 / CNY 7263 / WAIP 204) TaxID=349967 RepID=A0ABP2EAT0_YERMW|nr:hypothetical protein ymoll0001_36270 [Yersinia mollaretii ATCC 43969]
MNDHLAYTSHIISIFFNRFTAIRWRINREEMRISRGKWAEKIKEKGAMNAPSD